MINSWTGFQPLREVWLGAPWSEAWAYIICYRKQDQDNIRNIIKLTNNQLSAFQNIMESDGIMVRRPNMPDPEEVFLRWKEYKEYFETMLKQPIKATGDFGKFKRELQLFFATADGERTKPQMNPRDDFFVYGNTLYVFLPYCNAMAWWGETLQQYIRNGYDVRFFGPLSHEKYHIDLWNGAVPPSVVRLGKKVIVELSKESIENAETGPPGMFTLAKALEHQYHADVFISDSPDDRHGDGQFAVLRPGTALTSKSRTDLYDETFPGWNFIQHEPEYLSLSQKQRDEIDELRFVKGNIEAWIGDITETFFDVNVLVKDPENVYVSNKPPKSLGSNYTKVPWKYRWFWDGGLHCITLDINREGKQEDYFAS